MNQGKKRSWIAVILWIIVFWPVGIYFLMKKLSNDRSALMNMNTRGLKIVAWTLIMFGAIGFIGLVFDTTSSNNTGPIIVAIGFIVGGIILLRRVKNAYDTGVLYKRYLNMIVNHNERNLDNIASSTNSTYDEVKSILTRMIESGYIKDAYIHESSHELVINVSDDISSEATSKIVRCKGCGANNTVISEKISECEYCGSHISG